MSALASKWNNEPSASHHRIRGLTSRSNRRSSAHVSALAFLGRNHAVIRWFNNLRIRYRVVPPVIRNQHGATVTPGLRATGRQLVRVFQLENHYACRNKRLSVCARGFLPRRELFFP